MAPHPSSSPTTLRELIDNIAVLADAPEATKARLAKVAKLRLLHCAEVLYREGDTPTALYLVLGGRLVATREGELIGYTGRMQPVGEVGAISGEPRESTVRAVRDSLILEIPREPVLELLEENSAVLMQLTRIVIGRSRQDDRERRQAGLAGQSTFAVIPASPGAPGRKLAETLVRELGGWPAVRLITATHVDATLGQGAANTDFSDQPGSEQVLRWCHAREATHRYVIYAADSDDSRWAQRCVRQADRVLMLVEAETDPDPIPVMQALPEGELIAPVELVVLRPEGDPSPHTLVWQERARARAHYFVHPWHHDDLAALTRQFTGQGIGLVLGGGGARGFAHIGLIRALQQLDIPVDVMGGTSMGAFISALLACGFDTVEMTEIARETFVKKNHLNDYMLPRVALIRGHKFLTRMHDIFGDRQIEELRRTYFCMSTNLTTGAAVVHDRGPLYNWVATSMCVPGVAPPVAHAGELLCDGGVVDNLPTDVMQSLERGSIIACSVSAVEDIAAPGRGMEAPDPQALLKWEGPGKRPSFGEILMRTATLTSDTVTLRESVERADIFVRMPVEDVGMFDWGNLDDLIERGYRTAMEVLPPLYEKLTAA